MANKPKTIAWYEDQSRMLAVEIAERISALRMLDVDEIEKVINSYLNLDGPK
jgi:hypothetical protein